MKPRSFIRVLGLRLTHALRSKLVYLERRILKIKYKFFLVLNNILMEQKSLYKSSVI